MSHNRRRWEEPASPDRPSYRDRAFYDDTSWRHYTPPTEPLPRRSFNYWREEELTPTSHYPGHSYGWENYDERWRDDGRSWRSSYSRRRRDWDDPESRRERNPPYRDSSRHRYSTYTPAPSIPLSNYHTRNVIESMPPILAPPTPSPPPNKSSEPPRPSPAYLDLSNQPPGILRDPRTARKLLILDLNGTLLIRSARSRSRTSSAPQLRPVQPRPYMQSFRQYLFCADTKAWLDTMVWSSAQPHSVQDMVDKVFGATKDELKMVWNRKSLGLSEAEYHQKTVTTKDLTKAWDMIASAPWKIEGHSAVVSQSQSNHSAFTTLLLDDSPHKAVLQPYNHVCVPEYDSERRQHDLQSLLATKGGEKDKQKDQVKTAARSTEQVVSEKESYDVILLAVIGILEAVKEHSNVAGWIRKGGLWATVERREEVGEGGKTDLNGVVRTGHDARSTSGLSITSDQARLQTKMWFDDSSVVAYWVAQGRKTLTELGIQIAHGVTG